MSISFEDLFNFPKYGIPVKRGSKYYFAGNSGLQNQYVYYSINDINANESEAEVFFDPNKLSEDGTVALQFIDFSKDGKYCAYGISKGGSDWITIKIKDAETLEDLPDTLEKIKFSSPSWTPDNLGFFYAVSSIRWCKQVKLARLCSLAIR